MVKGRPFLLRARIVEFKRDARARETAIDIHQSLARTLNGATSHKAHVVLGPARSPRRQIIRRQTDLLQNASTSTRYHRDGVGTHRKIDYAQRAFTDSHPAGISCPHGHQNTPRWTPDLVGAAPSTACSFILRQFPASAINFGTNFRDPSPGTCMRDVRTQTLDPRHRPRKVNRVSSGDLKKKKKGGGALPGGATAHRLSRCL